MATTTKFGAYKNTANGTFVRQTIGGVILGVSSTSIITRNLPIITGLTLNSHRRMDVTPRQRTSSGIYRADKILSSGTFNYNSAKFGTWVISGIATSLAGVANNNILFMAAGTRSRPIAEYQHDVGVKMLSAWLSRSFAWTGKLASGATKNSRQMWLSADGTSVSAPVSLSTTFMKDIALNSVAAQANDNAARPTRAIPGEFTLRADLVTAGLSGGNFFDYKPITGM